MAVRVSTPVLVVRPIREVLSQRRVVRERDRKRTDPHCLSQSVAKPDCGALGLELSMSVRIEKLRLDSSLLPQFASWLAPVDALVAIS